MYKKVSKEIIFFLLVTAFFVVPTSKSPVQLSHAQPNQDMQAVLEVHNHERAAVDFPLLTWSDSLAADSQSWANHLASSIVCNEIREGNQTHLHTEIVCNPPVSHGAGNENIAYACIGCMSPAQLAQLWANEKAKYDAGQHSGPGIGHYTAMVWKNTREVGCGFSRNTHQEFLVCRYLPGGNIPGQASRAANLPNY